MRIDEFAKSVSHVLHANQKRNDGVTPYTVHTDYVGDNVEKYMYQLVESSTVKELEIARAIGYLHDVLEEVLSHFVKLFVVDFLVFKRITQFVAHRNCQ